MKVREMRMIAIAVLAYLCVSFPALAQNADTYLKFGYGPHLPVANTVDDLDTQLHFSTAGQREDLLKRIGVDPQILYEADFIASPTAIRVDEIEGTKAGMLFLPCSGPGSPSSHLYLLRPDEKQGWRVADTVNLDCWWKATTYEFVAIPGQSPDAVLVHHVNHGHGSNLLQDDMILLGTTDLHFAKLLETQEYKSTTPSPREGVVEKMSLLQVFPDSSIEETRETLMTHDSEAKRLIRVERRRFRWDENARRYLPGPFHTV